MVEIQIFRERRGLGTEQSLSQSQDLVEMHCGGKIFFIYTCHAVGEGFQGAVPETDEL